MVALQNRLFEISYSLALLRNIIGTFDPPVTADLSRRRQVAAADFDTFGKPCRSAAPSPTWWWCLPNTLILAFPKPYTLGIIYKRIESVIRSQ